MDAAKTVARNNSMKAIRDPTHYFEALASAPKPKDRHGPRDYAGVGTEAG